MSRSSGPGVAARRVRRRRSAIVLRAPGRAPPRSRSSSSLWRWLPVGQPRRSTWRFQVDQLSDRDAAGRDRGRQPDPPVQRRLHAGGPGLRALLRVPQPLRRLHAGAGAGRQLPGDVRRLGRGRALLLPADRLLVQRQGQRRRRQEGVHHEPDRRLRLPDRDVPHLARRSARWTSPRSSPRGARACWRRAARWSPRSRCSSSWAAPASRRRSRSTPGCPTRWPARRRSPR